LKGIIQHEMLHAMGFHHEQSRPDRDQFVTINLENIRSDFISNFDIAKSVVPNYAALSAYDYGSVMHYGAFDFTSNGKVVIVPKQSGVSIGQRDGLSTEDVKELRNLFKCSNTATTTQAPVTTTQAPATTTQAPVTTTQAPVTTTQAPVTTTQAPVTTTRAPVTTTQAPATTTQAPATTTQAPATTTQAPLTTTQAPVTTTQAPVTTTRAPVTTSEAPVTTSEAPVTTSEAPATTSEAPATTSEAPVTTEDPRTIFEVLNCNFTGACRGNPLNGLFTKFKRVNLRTKKEYLPGKTNCTDRATVCDIIPESLCTTTSPFKWTTRYNCPKLCDNCPRNSNTYLVSRNRRRSYFTAYSRFSNTGCSADSSASVTVSASFDFKTTDGSKSNVNQLYVYLLAYSRVNRRWVKNGASIKMDAITADTPRNVWNEFHIEGDLECSDFYYVYASTARNQRNTVSIDNLKISITK